MKKTKTNDSNVNQYLFPLAKQIVGWLTNDDIETCINVLSDSEKEALKEILLTLKIEVKTPEDYDNNLIIYHTVWLVYNATLKQENEAKKQRSFMNRTTLLSNK